MSSLAKRQAQFELGTTLSLFLWPSLTLAVTNNWGGPSSVSKREWFAATLIDVLKDEADADVPWIEQFLLQVMEDEFEVVVDDGSAMEVAEDIVKLRTQCERGVFTDVESMERRWKERRGREAAGTFKEVEGESQETSGSEVESAGEDDVEMEEAPRTVKAERRMEVDENGFTKVKKRR